MIKFSPSQLKFYHTLRHGTPPTDCVEVSQSAYAGLMYQQSKGMVFQADEKSINFMTASILTSQTAGITENKWKLVDNTAPMVTIAQLQQAHALAMQQLATTKGI